MVNYKKFKEGWPANGTICGWGSELKNTFNARSFISHYIRLLNIKSINDAGCGDLSWISKIIYTVDYLGYDLYYRENIEKTGLKFKALNIVEQDMRKCDLIVCRDVFIHLPNEEVMRALEKFKKSGKYLISTSFIQGEGYEFDNFNRIQDVDMHHSKIDLTSEPFSLGTPMDGVRENYPFKYLNLWKL